MSVAFEDGAPQARDTKRVPLAALFDAPDQYSVRAELATFFGPNADLYLAVYDKMRAAESGKRIVVRTWSWPVFLGSFTWFFYRKMYAIGAMVMLMPMLFAYLFGSTGLTGWVLFAMWAKTWYVNMALERIAKANQLGLVGAQRANYLERAGGVSLAGGLFAGFVYAALALLVVGALVARRHTGH